MDHITLIIVTGIIFSLAALVQGICGFGFSLLAVSILSMLIGPKTAVPLGLVVASSSCFYLAWLMRKHILYKETLLLVTFAVIFVPVGTLYLRQMDSSLIIRSIGVVTVLVSAISLLKAQHLRVFASKAFQYLAGIVAGLLGGAFNIPGPPLVLYAYNCHWPLINAKANLQFIFSAMVVIAYISYSTTGLLTLNIFGWGLIYIPLVFLFTFTGSRIAGKMKVRHLALLVNILLIILGTTLIIKG